MMCRTYRRLVLLLFLSLAVFSGSVAICASKASQDSNAEQLVKKFLKAEQSYSYSGIQIETTRSGRNSITTVTKVFHKKPVKYRYVFDNLGALGNRIVIDDGDSRWNFNANGNLVVRSESISDESSLIPWAKRFELLAANYDMNLLGTDTVAGRQCGIITLIPKRLQKEQPAIPSRKMWIDSETGIALRLERYDSGGTPVAITYFSEFAITSDIDSGLFVPRLAKGTKIVETLRPKPLRSLNEVISKTKREVKLPDKLPMGFEFTAGSLSKAGDKNVIILNYTDGLSTVSILQAYPPTNKPTRVIERDETTLMWEASTNAADITILGDIDATSLSKIAESAVSLSEAIISDSNKPTLNPFKRLFDRIEQLPGSGR